MKSPQPFSEQLHKWLKSSAPNTTFQLQKVFGRRSFAIVYILLLVLPALPIPTGGITHVFEIICMLLALEQIIGLQSVWLPKKPTPKWPTTLSWSVNLKRGTMAGA